MEWEMGYRKEKIMMERVIGSRREFFYREEEK